MSLIEHNAAPEASSDARQVIRWGYGIIGCALGLFVGWTLIARLDGAALAAGVVSSETNRKTLQHLEGGIVREILVRDGELVQEKQVLIRLDPTRTNSMGALYRDQLAIALAQEASLMAERDEAETIAFPAEVVALNDVPLVARAINNQQQQFAIRRGALLKTLEIVDAQIAQAVKDGEQNDNDNKTAREMSIITKRELDTVRGLFDKSLVALPRVSGLEREFVRLQGVIANTQLGAVKLKERIQELSFRRDQVKEDYRKDAVNRLVDVQKSITDLRQQLVIANDAQLRIDVRAPVTGVVQQLRVFTVGGVVRPGDPILDLAPASDRLIIRARVSPLDADRIAVDMAAEVRFPSFRYMGLKIIRGKVSAISRDRLLDDSTKDPYFDAQVTVDRKDLPDQIAEKLTAGMPAEVVVPTGERTVFNYLVTPIVERFQSSMRER